MGGGELPSTASGNPRGGEKPRRAVGGYRGGARGCRPSGTTVASPRRIPRPSGPGDGGWWQRGEARRGGCRRWRRRTHVASGIRLRLWRGEPVFRGVILCASDAPALLRIGWSISSAGGHQHPIALSPSQRKPRRGAAAAAGREGHQGGGSSGAAGGTRCAEESSSRGCRRGMGVVLLG